MSLLLFLARSSRALIASAVLASVINGLAVAWVVAKMNDALRAEGPALTRLGLHFAALSVAMLIFRWLSLGQFVRLSQQVLARLRMHVSRFIAEAPYAEVERHGGDRLLAVLTEDIAMVGEGFMLLPWLFVHGVVLLGCVGYLAVLSLPLLAFVLAMAVLGSLGYARGVRAAHGQLVQARLQEDALFGHFRELFAGAKELRLHDGRRTAFLDEGLGPTVEEVRRVRSRGLLVHAALANWRGFLVFAVIGSVVFGVATALGVAQSVRSGYALTLLYMILPVNALLEAAPSLSRMQVALERIEALGLERGLTGVDAAPASAPTALGPLHSIGLAGATHRYGSEDGEETFVLGPLSLSLQAPELVFIVGGNGSGKTTLAKLLTGLFEPESGQLLLNGAPVPAGALEAYRQHFSAVFADFQLFAGMEEVSEAMHNRACELLRALDLDRKVRIEAGRFSTTTALSSGQRKRLALLLCWLEDRPVVLFDEWAADQDPAYKEVFYRQVLPDLKRRGKLVIAITHDDRYFHLADRCLKLESGALLGGDAGAVHALKAQPTTVRGQDGDPLRVATGEP